MQYNLFAECGMERKKKESNERERERIDYYECNVIFEICKIKWGENQI